MKILVFIFSIFLFVTAVNAGIVPARILVGSNAKTSTLEIRFNSTHKKNIKAVVYIFNAAGKEVNNFNCDIKQGINAVCLKDALSLKEGIYTVKLALKKKTFSTTFLLFK